MTTHSRHLEAYHQPATMSVDCPVCGARAGHQCKTPRRQAERRTHTARVTRYRTVTPKARR